MGFISGNGVFTNIISRYYSDLCYIFVYILVNEVTQMNGNDVITGTILEGLVLIFGMPQNFAGWILLYLIAGLLFLLVFFMIMMIPYTLITRR